MLDGLAEEGVGGLDAVAFSDLDLPSLNHVGNLRVQERLFELLDRLDTALLESDEGKAPAAACHLVPHDRHVHHLSKALEVCLHISLYTAQRRSINDSYQI